MKLHTLVNEIFDIAKANNVGVGIGTDMLLENVRAGKESYKGVALDYKKLQPNLAELRASRNSYDDTIHEHYTKVCELRAQGKREAAKKLVCNE